MAGKTYVSVAAAAKDDPTQLLRDIDELERRAVALLLLPCSRALNNAKNAAGWQLAGDIEAADRASTHRI